ncbi:hypothetical protein ACGFW5_02100 [Streptomyces sp. NPDC048416]|uniref:hypothetical protein n=1 Tax=Streptomyces sp. NPDC048416 TaxID=3365546 RepID=UPI00371F3493
MKTERALFAFGVAAPGRCARARAGAHRSALGFIVFEIPTTSKVTKVQFAMDSGFSDDTGQWVVS